MVLLTTKSLDVAKFTNLTPLSLLISCEISFPIVGLKISSLPTFIKYLKIDENYLGQIPESFFCYPTFNYDDCGGIYFTGKGES
jgi:hypothetical protein